MHKILQDQIIIQFTKTADSAMEACRHFHNRMVLQSIDQPTEEAHNYKLFIYPNYNWLTVAWISIFN